MGESTIYIYEGLISLHLRPNLTLLDVPSERLSHIGIGSLGVSVVNVKTLVQKRTKQKQG
jgi:hypothetical protein